MRRYNFSSLSVRRSELQCAERDELFPGSLRERGDAEGYFELTGLRVAGSGVESPPAGAS